MQSPAMANSIGLVDGGDMMPILCEEPSVYPEWLLEENSLDPDPKWHVVYTRARHEKSLARHMVDHQMSFYLPLVQKESFIRGRRTRSFLPVFSGYLFYFGDAPGDLPRLAPHCVSCVFPVSDQDQLRNELRAIHQLLAEGCPMTIEARLSAGRKVRVKSGALKGIEGTIIRRKNSHRLLVAVEYLQQGVSIEVDDYMVETI
jgi:hypothetical protein